MQLTTYRLSHDVGSERHHNAVLADLEGSFRGHVDCYSEIIEPDQRSQLDQYWMVEGEGLQAHEQLEIFIFYDTKEKWVVDVICPNNLRPIQIIEVIDKKIDEARKIYDSLPTLLPFTLADKTITTLNHGNQYILLSVTQSNYLDQIQPFISNILEHEFGHRKGLPNLKAINTGLRLLDQNILNLSKTMRLVTDEFLHTPITVPFEEEFPLILNELKKEFSFPEYVYIDLLKGNKSVIDILNETDDLTQAIDLIAIIDFGKKLAEIKNTGKLYRDMEIEDTVRDILLKYQVLAELEKGTNPKKVADRIFNKELKAKDPEITKKLVAEMVLQSLRIDVNSELNKSLEELLDHLQDKSLKQAKKVSKAMKPGTAPGKSQMGF